MAIRRVPGPAQPVHDVRSDVARVVAGQAMRKWVNDITPGAGWSDLNNPGLVYNLQRGDCILIVAVCIGITTVSDSGHFVVCTYDQPDAAGAYTEKAKHLHILTGAAIAGFVDYHHAYTPPLVVKYADGARSVSFRVQLNDAACNIGVGWSGWKECE